MPSIREIKRRKQNIQSISQITKAMKLVSASKLQKAKDMAASYAPYTKYLSEMVNSILDLETEEIQNHPKKAMIVISSNRGLAGGFHSNLLKTILNSKIPKEQLLLYTFGERVRDGLIRKDYRVEKDYSDLMSEAAYDSAVQIGREILALYTKQEVGEVYLAYTLFKNTVTQTPVLLKLLPPEKRNSSQAGEAPMNYEPNQEEVLEKVMPLYLNSLIYGALLESAASEQGARMQAMDSASKSAGDMMEELSLQYNRARQGTITRELTEIISGVEALN